MLTKEQFEKAILQGKKYCVLEYLGGISIVLLKDDLSFDGALSGEWELVVTNHFTKIYINDPIESDRIRAMIDDNEFYNWIFEYSLVDGRRYDLITK